MRRSPLFLATVYLVLGVVFIVIAIQNVSMSGWNFFTYFLIILATLDIGSGIRLISLHRQIKKMQDDKNNSSS